MLGFGRVALGLGLAVGGCLTGCAKAAAPVEGYRVVATFPHSTASYTEGFFYLNGMFYEGTGMEGRSGVVVTDPATGRVSQRHDLGPQYFGEGIVDWGPNVYEWTWKSHVCFVYESCADGESESGLVVAGSRCRSLRDDKQKTLATGVLHFGRGDGWWG
jgi:glutamine cyclotransferase